MDKIFEIYRYLPLFPKEEEEYFTFLRAEIEGAYSASAFQSAYLTAHMLFMYYIYNCVWKIKQAFEDRYYYGIVGFPKYNGSSSVDLRELNSLFDLSLIAEKTIFGIFQIVDIDNSLIIQLKRSVDTRNNIAHSTGQISFPSEESFIEGLNKIIRLCERIHKEIEQKVIRPCYESFLLDNKSEDFWEYPIAEDQISEGLIREFKLSELEMKTCNEFGVSKFSDKEKYNLSAAEIETIRNLHAMMIEISESYLS